MFKCICLLIIYLDSEINVEYIDSSIIHRIP
jgi:hypothetical protein